MVMNLARARIRNLIVEAAGQGVCLLAAPAGCGKTEALNDARPHLGQIFDIALAAEVIPAGELGRALVAALAPRDVRNFGTLIDRSPSVEEIVLWLNRRLRNVRGTAIVDDFHRTAIDASATKLLAGVIEGTRTRINWVIASRTMPDLPIGSWLATGHLSMPIEEEELLFTRDEAAGLAASLEVDVDAESLDKIFDDTGGWAIALRLSLDFWSRTGAVQPLRLRTRAVLFRYIESEIWGRLDNEDERMMLGAASLLHPIRTSILTSAGFANAADTLQRIKRVPLVTRSDSNKFFIHDILREFSLQRLRERGDLAAVVRRVGFALQDLGHDAEALQLFAEIGDHESTIAHLAEHGLGLLDFGRRATVNLALGTLPRSAVFGNPVIAGINGALEETIGSFSAAELQYRNALDGQLPVKMRVVIARRLAVLLINRSRSEEALPILADVLARKLTLQDETVLRAARAVAVIAPAQSRERADASSASMRCMEEIEFVERNIGLLDPELRARTYQLLAAASFYLQNWDEAAHSARQSADLALSLGLDAHAARSFSVLYSVISLTTAEPGAAAVVATQWIAAAERGGDTLMLISGHRAKYVTAIDCGDENGANAAEKALSSLGDTRSFNDTLPARIARAMREAGKGNLPKAVTSLSMIADRDLTSAERVLRTSMLAVIRAAQRNADETRSLLKSPSFVALGEARDVFSRRYHNLAQAYRALALWLIDSQTAARKSINLNADIAGMAARDRAFVQVISNFCHMSLGSIDDDVAVETTAPLDELGLHGVAKFLRMCCTRVDEKPAPLTASEFEVLRAFKSGSTEAAVADVLGKSKHTVHKQMATIIKKIGCSGRAEALEYARAQGWI